MIQFFEKKIKCPSNAHFSRELDSWEFFPRKYIRNNWLLLFGSKLMHNVVVLLSDLFIHV